MFSESHWKSLHRVLRVTASSPHRVKGQQEAHCLGLWLVEGSLPSIAFWLSPHPSSFFLGSHQTYGREGPRGTSGALRDGQQPVQGMAPRHGCSETPPGALLQATPGRPP